MKKFLSLVLALIMTMSLVTISAGAKDFTDNSKITYKEAVDVMSAVKVIDGYEDGSFNPQGNLTRGAAAKIICNLILGPTTAAALRADTAPYKDVPVNHTFAGYIAYCQQQGIISGYADGTFRPSATLTNYAFLKMLLGALGYDAITEGYVGDNWSIQVAKQALATGLTKGMVTELNGTEAATREQACLYALNTLQATMVEYVQKTTVNVSGANVVLSGTIRDVEWGTGKLYDGNIEDDGFVQFAEKYFTNLELEVGHGIYGRPANTWKLKKAEIGTYTTKTPTYVFTEGTKEKDVYKELSKALFDEDDYTWEYYVNGKEVDGKQPSKNGDKDYVYTGEGTVTEIYVKDSYRRDNYGNKVDPGTVTVVEYNHYIGEVSKVKDDIITVKALSAEPKLDDKTFAIDGYEEDDYVVFTVDYDEDEDDYIIGEVFEPETVTGDVKRVESDKNSEKSYLKMDDGEQYDYAESKTHNVYDLENINVAEHPELNTEYTLYLDPNGYVLGFKKGDDGSKYLYVKDSDEELRDWVAKVVLDDATSVKADLKKDLKKVPENFVGGDEINWIDAKDAVITLDKDVTNIDGRIWKYTVSDSGVYTLTYVAAEYPTDLYEINNGEAYIDPEDKDTGDNRGLIVDKKTLFVDIDGEKVYTGYDEVPNISNAKIAYVLKNGVVEVMFIIDGEIYDKNSTYFILTSDKRESFKYDGDDYWMLKKAWVNGENETLNVRYDAFNGPALLSGKKDDAKYWNLQTGVLYKAVKSITDGDETYITKVEEAKPVISGAPVAVGDASFQVVKGTTSNFMKFTAKETVFVLVEWQPKDLKAYEKAEDAGKVYNDPDDFELIVSEGRISDMKVDKDDPYDTIVSVVTRDDQDAELVYIYHVYPDLVGTTYDLLVNGEKVASYAEDVEFTRTIPASEGKKITAVTGDGITAVIAEDGKSATISGKMTKNGIKVTVTEETIIETKTLRLEATDLLNAKVYVDAAGKALTPSKTETRFGEIVAVEYEIPAGETATILYKAGTPVATKQKTVKMTDDVTITDKDMSYDAGTSITVTIDGKSEIVAKTETSYKLPKGNFLYNSKAGESAPKTAASAVSGKITGLKFDRDLVTAYEIVLEKGLTATLADGKTTAQKYVAAGEEIIVKLDGTYKVNGVVKTYDNEDVTIPVDGKVEVLAWETEEEFKANVDKAIKDKVKTDADNKIVINEDGTVDVTVTDPTKTGTGLMDLVAGLVKDGYDVVVTSPSGYDYPLSGDMSKDKTTLSKLIVAGTKATFVVTISSDKADAEIVYTVNVDATGWATNP